MHPFFLVTLAVLSIAASGNKQIAKAYPIDIAHSHATFSIAHLYVIEVPGSVPIVSGVVSLGGGSVVPTRISSVLLDPRRIDTNDPDRNDSLQGPKWFDTKHFPTWRFSSKSIKNGSRGAFTVDGLLTVHGVTQPIVLQATTTHGFPNPAYHAVGHIDRHLFGMLTSPIDGTISSDVKISIDVVLANGALAARSRCAGRRHAQRGRAGC